MKQDVNFFRAIVRDDFPSFVNKSFSTLSPSQPYVENWHIRALAYQLERVRLGESRRLIVNMPPRSLKSLVASVAFPAFVLGHSPDKRIICVSYSNDLARKLSNDFRAILATGWYKRIFPYTKISSHKDTESEIEFTRRGFRYATSTLGTLTGRGGEIIIIDDPLKPLDASSDVTRTKANEWFRHTLLSRLDDKRTGSFVIIMQRLHMDDLVGFVRDLSDDWEVLSLPAIAERDEEIPISRTEVYHRREGEALSPQREPLEILAEIRRQVGADLFQAQYQQNPVPPGGLMIKREWIKRYTEPSLGEGKFTLQSWDTAMKGGAENDWSVCTTWLRDDANWYLLDVWRARVLYPDLKAKMQEMAKQWGAHQVLVEEAGIATGLLEELKGVVTGLVGIKPKHDKATRMSIASAVFQAGQVYLPERAPWLAELEAELFAFPGSRYDDQIDSISQAINHGSSSNVYIWHRLGEQAMQNREFWDALERREREAARYRRFLPL